MAYFANGTEAAIFEEANCVRCVHSDYRPGKDIGDRDNPPCPVWMAHQLFAYELGGPESEEHPGKVILDMLIPDERPIASDGLIAGPVSQCAMFCPRDRGAEIPGQTSLEVGA